MTFAKEPGYFLLDAFVIGFGNGMLAVVTSLLVLWLIRRFRIKRTCHILHSFTQGNWQTTMKAKNIYAKDSFVLYYTGVGYLYGLGNVRQDYARAEKCFSQSAVNGNPAALIGLGWMAENGFGKPKNIVLAQQLYRDAKEKLTQ